MQAIQNMIRVLTEIRNAYNQYSASYINMTAIILLVILIRMKESGKREVTLGKYAVIILILTLNPLSYNNIKLYGITQGDYHKVFYLIPAIVLVAYIMVEYIFKGSYKKIAQIISVYVVVGIVCADLTFTLDNFEMDLSKYKIDQEIYEVQSILSEYQPYKILAPLDISTPLVELGMNYKFLYGYREINGEYIDWDNNEEVVLYEAVQDMRQNPNNIDSLLYYARYYECDCLIIEEQYEIEEWDAWNGIEAIGRTSSYVVYKL